MNTIPSNISRYQLVTNAIISILTGWLVWNLLLFPFSFYLMPMIAKGRLPVNLLDFYNVFMFCIIGIVIGIRSKVKTPIVIVLTFCSIFSTLILIGKDESIVPYLNYSTFIELTSIVAGGFIGNKIKLQRQKSQ